MGKREWQPRYIEYYIFIPINADYLLIDKLSDIQYGQALDRLVMEVVIADPYLEPIYALKADVSNGFYHIALHPGDARKMVLVFPISRKWIGCGTYNSNIP